MADGEVVDLVLSAREPRIRRREPVACGVPWPRGRLRDVAALRLESPEGAASPVQVSVLDRWTDGSVRWALVRWQATLEGEATWRLRLASPAEPPVPVPETRALSVERQGRGVRIRSGALEVSIAPGDGFPFVVRAAGAGAVLRDGESGFRVFDARGRVAAAKIAAVAIEEEGPLCVRVRVDYALDEPLAQALRVSARLSFHAGSPAVRFDLALHNPRRAQHPGGFWELGDPGSFLFRGAAVRLVPEVTAHDGVRASLEPGMAEEVFPVPFGLLQESSGGANGRSPVHVNREGAVPIRFDGYRVRSRGEERRGRRAEPTLRAGSLGVAFPGLWQHFPKSIGVDREGVTLQLFPEDAADLHELQGGERKTHTFWIAFGPDETADPPLAWCRDPVRVRAEPRWYVASGAVPDLAPLPDEADPGHEALLAAAVEGPASVFAKRERIDEYGWRHFGDVYADHEAVFHEEPAPLVSHYNNQYDAIAGFLRQFLRTGDFRWWTLADDLARHVADVDVYHTDEDKAAYNHGLFWHTQHYVDAGKSTHRCYPRIPGVHGGGPSNEHNYTTGLLLHHFLTGDPLSRETVLELARWVLDMDDGDRTVFRWLARGATGLASSTADFAYHGPGRGAGNSINALLDAFQLTRERRFLDAAEALVRRCIHPRDDVGARDLLDAERRWSYVVFLQKLGRYLVLKDELGEDDGMREYARGALLHYARWMLGHEGPFLERAAVLEYPNETWAAQDLRKADVLALAAAFSPEGEERSRFLERAEFFRRYAIDTLRASPTATLTRPLAIALTSGLVAGSILAAPPPPRPAGHDAPFEPGRPEVFVPQKARALRRARILALTAAGAALLGALLFG